MANKWNRSKTVIVGIFLLALVLSGYAWWHQFQQSPRCRAFFGAERAELIRLAPRVELLRLAPPPADDTAAEGADAMRLGGRYLRVTERVEITDVPGLLHARHALLQDANYQWERSAADCARDWKFALSFSREGQRAVIAFDTNCHQIGLDDHHRTVSLLPELMHTFAEKSEEWEQRGRAAASP